MKIMTMHNGDTQYTFWGNVDYATNDEAKRKRDDLAKALRAEGRTVKRSMLANQLHKYSGFGQYDGTVGNVYYLREIAPVPPRMIFDRDMMGQQILRRV